MRVAACRYPVGAPADFAAFAAKQETLLREARACGAGVALLPESVARTRADSDSTLALRPVTGVQMHRQVHLVAPRPHLRSAACQAFIACVHDHLATH